MSALQSMVATVLGVNIQINIKRQYKMKDQVKLKLGLTGFPI